MAGRWRITFGGGLGFVDVPLAARGDVRVGDRLLPPSITVTMPGDGVQPGLRMLLAVVDGIPQVREIHLEAPDGGRGVRSSDLREVRVEDFTEQFFALASKRIVTEGPAGTTSRAEGSPQRQREAERLISRARAAGRRTVTDDLLSRVADVYRANVATRPTEAVRQTFGVSYRTAAGYVQRARAGGMLPRTTAGKRKA